MKKNVYSSLQSWFFLVFCLFLSVTNCNNKQLKPFISDNTRVEVLPEEKPPTPEEKPLTPEEKRQQIMAQILIACERVGMQDANTIYFRGGGMCEYYLEAFTKYSNCLSYRSYIGNNNLKFICNDRLPEELQKYQHPKPGNPQELFSSCIMNDQTEKERHKIKNSTGTVELFFEPWRLCQSTLEEAFVQDWEGFVQKECKMTYDEKVQIVTCKKGVPEEFQYHMKPALPEEVLMHGITKHCAPVKNWQATSQTMMFQDDYDCINNLNRAVKYQAFQEKGCYTLSNTNLGFIGVHCEKDLPVGFSSYQVPKTTKTEVVKGFQTSCQRVGPLRGNNMFFFGNDLCLNKMWLVLAQKDFQEKKCGLSHGVNSRRDDDILMLSCNGEFPSVMDFFRTKEVTNAAYITWLKNSCNRVGIIESNQLFFKKEETCRLALQEALENDWPPFTKHQCKEPILFNERIEFSCANKIPKEMKQAFQGQEAILKQN